MRHPEREKGLTSGRAQAAAVDETDVLIVGAGPAGLAAAYELDRRGLHVAIVDGAPRIGEPWRKRHADLRLNTHRRYSHLPGLKIPRSAGTYPSRDAFVRYLEAYERFLRVPIAWGVRVEEIARDAEGRARWTVRTSRGRILARDVVVATGPDRIPVTPTWPGAQTFTGDLRHAAAFEGAAAYAGKRVLIVGAGNSGVDLANCLARVETRALWMSVRAGATLVPRRLFGIPIQPLAVAGRNAPRWYQDMTTAQLSRLAFGSLADEGIPTPAKGPLTRFIEDGVAVSIDDGCVAALRAGRLQVVPEVVRFDGAAVHLADGSALTPDVVIAATGYRTGLEPLVGRFGVLDTIGRPKVVGGSSGVPGLWFVGQRSNFHGNLHARGLEARTLAGAITRTRRRSASPFRAWAQRVATLRLSPVQESA